MEQGENKEESLETPRRILAQHPQPTDGKRGNKEENHKLQPTLENSQNTAPGGLTAKGLTRSRPGPNPFALVSTETAPWQNFCFVVCLVVSASVVVL